MSTEVALLTRTDADQNKEQGHITEVGLTGILVLKKNEE